ncbi:DUF2634 domain-containing protein [Clostridiales Family XIII bacterium ASD5510]|uniref:DUF2634 domain-containing protein n=1 Tax=Hominibacterium faecale TaxID=2839743 RepID=A0A9J6QYJ8_9FIRM|nr:DUF2634 domain-containing protein [Hominibacterium faecale]MCU7380525.1 DUF2634 domain-containing protein [Hominibacterium faecale]
MSEEDIIMDEDELEEDEEESLFPEDMDELTMEEEELEEDEPAGYVSGIAFSDDFIRDGQNRLITATGVEAWKQWCMNCIAMERDSSVIYSPDYGIYAKDALATSDRNEAESILIREITEALKADPLGRTDYVAEIEFVWGPDSVTVQVEVVGIDEATIDIEVPIVA